MIRFYNLFYISSIVLNSIILIRLFTSLYAGLNVLVERDIKKIIALSTLRHLGFIGLAFSCGMLYLSFFHLLVHALFKSLMFIAIGDIIVSTYHFQDFRFLSRGLVRTKFSNNIIMMSLLSLLGLPSFRGFYSKDFVLESIIYSNLRVLAVIVTYINIFFTMFYRFKLFSYIFTTNKSLPYSVFHSTTYFHTFLLSLIGLTSLCFSFVFIKIFYFYFNIFMVSNDTKILPFLVLSAMFILFYLSTISFNSLKLYTVFSSMLYLKFITMYFSSQINTYLRESTYKSLEQGFIPSINKSLHFIFFDSRILMIRLTLFSFPFLFLFFSFSFLFL